MGATHVIIRKIEPAEFFKLVTEEQVTLDCMPPTMINAALNHPIDEATRRRMPPMRIGTAGSAPPMATIQGAQEKFGWRSIQIYGLMETSPLLTVSNVKPTMRGLSEEEKLRWQTKTGYPMIGVDVRVVDKRGEDIAPNSLEAGEVIARSNVVMAGYWKHPDATNAVIADSCGVSADRLYGFGQIWALGRMALS